MQGALSTNLHVDDIFALMCMLGKIEKLYIYIYTVHDMLWQLDVSLTNGSVQDESGRIRWTEFEARATSGESIFMNFRVFQHFHADIESDRSFRHLFCLNSRLRATTPEDLQGING